MNVLVVSPRFLPVFNKNNEGAIEKLEQIYLRFNEDLLHADTITVYSPKISKNDYDGEVLKNCVFRIIDQTTIKYKVSKTLFALKKIILRNSSNEAYIRAIIKDLVSRGERERYDIVVFENGERDIPLFAKKVGAHNRIVLHLHNDYINKDIRGSKEILEHCSEVWTVSNFLKERVNEVKEIKTVVIPNTINSDYLKRDLGKIEILKKKYLKNNEILFLYIGRLIRSKGILELLIAYDRFCMLNSNSKLLLIGKTEKGIKGKIFERIIKKHQEKNKNIHKIGYVLPKDLINYQAIADCQIIPSICNEAFGLVVLEAMASNKRIIASKIGGIPEVGMNKVKYVDVVDLPSSLFEAMRKINKSDDLPSDYYCDILEQFTEDKYCERMYGAIHEK